MTSNGTLDERYLIWLHRQVEPDSQRNPVRSHWLLCEQLFQKEFTWFIPNDHNRLYDGLDVRQEYIDAEEGGDVPGHWLAEPCSFLEMIIALARRMAYETDQESDFWFWTMMENMDLRAFVDDGYNDDVKLEIDARLTAVNERTYHADGTGGLFPVRHGGRDQRQVELWYQMSQYLMENVSV